MSPLKYKYLFRSTILSKSSAYELARVLSGRVYYPRYFYIPVLKQYLIYSEVDKRGAFRFHRIGEGPEGKVHTLLDDHGHMVRSFETDLRFSTRSGCFYGVASFIPWLKEGKTELIPYDTVYNVDFNLDQVAFDQLFVDLYEQSDYVEFVNLRASQDDDHQAGVIFNRKGKVEMLLSGLRDSRLSRRFQEDPKINDFEDYYTTRMSNSDAYPSSPPLIELQPLQTSNVEPFSYWRHWFKHPFRITSYQTEHASGWHGLGKIYNIPIYVPGGEEGTAYVKYAVHNDVFKIKILDVYKSDYLPRYNLGLRTFELPKALSPEQSLVFMESAQNGGESRLGGGVFVVRPYIQDSNMTGLPTGMTEEQFCSLPINLQAALSDSDGATDLIIDDKSITAWIPEIEHLKSLTHLKLNTSMTELPDGVASLKKLQVLSMEYGNIQKVSQKLTELTALRELHLYSNQLNEFPEVILTLKNLKHLDVGANLISSLPDEISQLKQLEYLGIVMTSITELPMSMVDMDKLYVRDDGAIAPKLPEAYQHLFQTSN